MLCYEYWLSSWLAQVFVVANGALISPYLGCPHNSLNLQTCSGETAGWTHPLFPAHNHNIAFQPCLMEYRHLATMRGQVLGISARLAGWLFLAKYRLLTRCLPTFMDAPLSFKLVHGSSLLHAGALHNYYNQDY